MIERYCVYARDDQVASKIREKIETFPNPLIEELKTTQGVTKFEFFGTMTDGLELMGLGASSFGKV